MTYSCHHEHYREPYIIRHTNAIAAKSTQVQSGLQGAGWLTAAAASEIGDQSQEPDVGNDTGKTLLQARIAVSERS